MRVFCRRIAGVAQAVHAHAYDLGGLSDRVTALPRQPALHGRLYGQAGEQHKPCGEGARNPAVLGHLKCTKDQFTKTGSGQT